MQNPSYESSSEKEGKNTCKCVSVPFMVQHTENYSRAMVSGTLFPANKVNGFANVMEQSWGLSVPCPSYKALGFLLKKKLNSKR